MDRHVIETAKRQKSKQGFGIMEVVVSMVIMALMASAVMYMQYWNRVAALRIQTRNEATQIAQNYLDSLRAQGLASVVAIPHDTVFGSVRNLMGGASVRTKYVVVVSVADQMTSNPINVSGTSYTATHSYSKQLNVDVSWVLNKGTYHIKLAGVVE
jgi:prepilin-type N-terminal cleavage/methylation domain-containing protein